MPHDAALFAAARASRRLGLIAIKDLAEGCARLETDRPECTKVRAVLYKLRHRRRRWIAFLAAFVLLFNQIALAQHLCLYRPGESPRASQAFGHSGNAASCHGATSDQTGLADIDATACAAHCDDGDKQTRDTPPLKVPDLVGMLSDVALLRLSPLRPEALETSAGPEVVHWQRTTVCDVLLI